VSTKGGSILTQHAAPKLPDPTASMHNGDKNIHQSCFYTRTLLTRGSSPIPDGPMAPAFPGGSVDPASVFTPAGSPPDGDKPRSPEPPEPEAAAWYSGTHTHTNTCHEPPSWAGGQRTSRTLHCS
jgi:hypothetical protein